MNKVTSLILTALLLAPLAVTAVANDDDILLFSFFRKNGEAGTYLAWSENGVHFRPLNDDKPIFPPAPWPGQILTRDPSIVYRDGRFRTVWTSSWKGRVFGYAESPDLVRWSEPAKVQPFPDSLPTEDQPQNVWAPEIHWDPAQKNFAILFSSTTDRESRDGDGSNNNGKDGHDHRIYITRTVDGRTFTDAKLFFDQNFSVIDAQMALHGERWVMVVKQEQDIRLGGKNLRLTFAPSDLSKPWSPVGAPVFGPGSAVRPTEMVEGACLVKWKSRWHLYSDAFANGHYSMATSPDLQTWTDRTAELTMPPNNPRHGTIFRAPQEAVGFLRQTTNTPRVELGEPETVLADGQLGLKYFPDERLAVMRTKPDCRVIVAAGVSSFLLEGPAMGKFTKATEVLEKGKPGEFDNGYAGISAAVCAPSGELLAFYHAEDQEGMKTVGNGIPGFYCRVGLAVSKDDGLTFEKRGPILSGQLPKDPSGRGDQGVGEPWMFVEPKGEFLYAYYSSHERVNGRSVQICMARCPVADTVKPGAWKKFHEGGFTEAGLGGKDTPVVTSGQKDADALFPHVVFVPALRQFMMMFCLNVWREGDKPERSGIYAAFSDDGIHWPRERMQQLWKVPVIAAIGREVAWHPTFIPDDGSDTRGWLYYGYSENWGHKPPHKPHYMARRRLTF